MNVCISVLCSLVVISAAAGTLKAVQGVLNALGQILLGPPRPGQAIGGAGGGPVGGVLDLIKVAQSLVEKLLKLP